MGKHDDQYEKKEKEYQDKLKDIEQKQRYKNIFNSLTFGTFTKTIVAFIVAFAMICVIMSYILAFLNYNNTMENLSSAMVNTILGVTIVYMIRAYFDTKAEHNEKNGIVNKSSISKLLDLAAASKADSILSNASISSNLEAQEQEKQNQEEDSIGEDFINDDESHEL